MHVLEEKEKNISSVIVYGYREEAMTNLVSYDCWSSALVSSRLKMSSSSNWKFLAMVLHAIETLQTSASGAHRIQDEMPMHSFILLFFFGRIAIDAVKEREERLTYD